MTDQTLFDQPQTRPRYHNRDPLLGADEWIAANPLGWQLYCGLLIEQIRLRERPSPKAAAEELRKQLDVRMPKAHRWKIDNSIVAGLSRRFCEKYPDIAHLVPRRISRADR